ncbi:DUF5058 domain-containing protein [Deltaproteobacteria bacterium Smac51]|nr:DUF5058 domain-containing protein [Deltaproteobacteria bacterium Smac51]
MDSSNYMDIANSFWMWVAAGSAVTMVLIQAFIFARKSYSTGLEIGLTHEQMRGAIKSSAITAFGPSIVVLSAMIALLVSLGGPISWMRLSFIGSAMFEMMAASFGTQAMGVTIGSDPMTSMAYANAVWTMTLGALGWIVFATLSADKMDKVQKKFSGSDTKLMGVVASGAILAAFGANSATHLVALNKNTVSCIAGGLVMLVLNHIADSKNIKWLREWNLFFALLGGMMAAVVWPM